jgi:HTH-type transcriptional regulator/antitoxin HigA
MRKRLNTNHISPVAMQRAKLLRSEIKEWRLTQSKLSEKLGISQPFLNGLLREKKKISIELALKLEETLNIQAEFWVKMQRLFDKVETRNKTEISLKTLDIPAQKKRIF